MVESGLDLILLVGTFPKQVTGSLYQCQASVGKVGLEYEIILREGAVPNLFGIIPANGLGHQVGRVGRNSAIDVDPSSVLVDGQVHIFAHVCRLPSGILR
ncbi:hypothetical protein ES707_14606 [subsurface metagenome]